MASVFLEVVEDTPFIITPAAANVAEPLYKVAGYKWVTSYIAKVRSMGTATYIGFGNDRAQLFRLTSNGATKAWSGNPGEVTDLSRIWIISDANDPVIEFIATYLPAAWDKNVILALDQRS